MGSAVTSDVSSRPGYGQLLRTPGALSFVLPGFAARQPFAMLTISIVLLVQHTSGSYGTAGLVAAAAGTAVALCAPVSGKLSDRYGQSRVLVPTVAIHASAVVALALLALAGAPVAALMAAALAAGATIPQIGPMVRARWAARLPADSPLLQKAAAFESVTDEFTFVIGPVFAAALCSGIHPAAGLLAEAVLTLAGGLFFAASRATAPPVLPAAERGKHPSALRVPGVLVLAVVFLGIGSVFGGMQVSLTAFSEEIGNPGVNGVLYGIFAAGNMLAGIAFGMVHWKVSPRRRLLVAYPLLVAATATLWTVHSAPLLGALGLVVGVCIAPALITGFTLVDQIVPAASRTEAYTWLTGAVAMGQALAASAAGRLTDAGGASLGFLVPLAGTGLAAVVLLALRSRLTPGAGASRSRIAAQGARLREPLAVD
ncbi:MFS transporter [Streptomyces polyrhachis]|uniref:MFS transporter n=1 Tax=Streptomyces polyrhachis TaxID=1282885 RepID=A0ABW2GR19_9ACTN